MHPHPNKQVSRSSAKIFLNPQIETVNVMHAYTGMLYCVLMDYIGYHDITWLISLILNLSYYKKNEVKCLLPLMIDCM